MIPNITDRQYLQRKIDASRLYDSDRFYITLANSICRAWDSRPSFPELNAAMKQEVALNLTGYMMDIVADLGLWRAFSSHCRELYGSPVPFFDTENYIDYELNLADVRFLTWYSICFMGNPGLCPLYPLDNRVISLADTFFNIMEEVYEDAPRPEGMVKTNNLEMHDPEDAGAIQTLGHWVFWSSYLAVPCFKSNMAMIYSQARPDDRQSLLNLMGEAQMELPTGPLALFLREWIWLIVTGKMPPQPRHKTVQHTHPYYKPFLEANGGSRIAFFNDYTAMNVFLGKALGWDPEADNLPQLKDSHDFTLLVNEKKGLLIGRDVARCIRHENNDFYDSLYAADFDFNMLVSRGLCPVDLTLFCLEEGLLPDLEWPGIAGSGNLTISNADFIARCFLLQYYRAI